VCTGQPFFSRQICSCNSVAPVQGKHFCASSVPAVKEDTERSLTPFKGRDFIPNTDGWDEGA